MTRKARHNRPAPVARPEPRQGMRLHPDLAAMVPATIQGPMSWAALGYTPTMEEVRKHYGPAITLGAPADKREPLRMAMDSALDNCGGYTLIQHAFEMGQGSALGGQFMGYAALSGLVQNGLISACVDTVADDMTRKWITLNRVGEAVDDEDLPLDELSAEMDGYNLRGAFKQASTWTGYFGGCLIFIDTGERDPGILRQPLNLTGVSGELRNGGLKRFTAIEPINTFPGNYNSLDPLSPDYFIPRSWWVLGTEVHASRLIHMHSGLPPVLLRPNYNFYGVPHAQILYDYVLHFQDCRTAAQELLTKFSLTALKTDMTTILSGGGSGALETRLAYFVQKRNNNGVMAIDKDAEDLVKLETPLSGVTDIVKQSLEFVAAINRTPAVKLLGISPSGFNATGESDLRNYYDHIASQQEKELRDGLEKALTAIQISRFGDVDPTIGFDFNPLSDDDERAKAEVQKIKADTVAVYVDRGVLSQEEAREAIAADPDSGFNDIDVENVPPAPGFMYEDAPDANPSNELAMGVEQQAGLSPEGKAEEPAADPKEISLNGAQVASMVDIVSQVAQGLLPRESGKSILLAAFPLSPEDADHILGEAGGDFTPDEGPDGQAA